MKVIHRLMEKKTRDLENQIQHRSQPVEFDIKEDRTIEFPFSSEKPVYRGVLGNEILDHREGAIDFSRLNDAAPLLFNHDVNKPIGVVEKAWTKDQRGYARVRFSDNPFPSEVYNDVKNGILRGVSVGYSVNETREEKEKEDHYRVTSWTPAEISIAVVAADESVGVGRAQELEEKKTEVAMPTQQESSNMEAQRTNDVEAASVASQSKPSEKTEMTDTPDLSVVRSEERKAERVRTREITALFKKHEMGEDALDRLLDDPDADIHSARKMVCDKIGRKTVESVADPVDYSQEKGVDYSIAAGIRGALTGDWSTKEAGFVRELSQEVERSGVKRTSERSFLIPYTALTQQRSTYLTSGSTTGGNLVETDLRDGDFIENLKNNTLMMGMGVQTLPGLVGDVAIPRRSGSSSAYWLASETTAITQSESTFDQIQLQPKTAGVLSKFSRQTLLQATPGIEQLIRTDLSNTVNIAVDLAILNGSGSSGQPTGIMQTSGIGSVAGGTNGAAITLENLINLEKEVLIDNAGGNNMGYVTNAKVLAKLKQLRAGGSAAGDGAFLWNTDLSARGRGSTPGVINGYQIGVTNQVPSNLTKGSASSVCSAVLFGDFSQCTVGFWGNGMEIAVSDSDGTDFTNALVSVRALTTLDVAVRQASAFSAILDVLT